MVHSLGALPSGGTALGNSRKGVKKENTDATTKMIGMAARLS